MIRVDGQLDQKLVVDERDAPVSRSVQLPQCDFRPVRRQTLERCVSGLSESHAASDASRQRGDGTEEKLPLKLFSRLLLPNFRRQCLITIQFPQRRPNLLDERLSVICTVCLPLAADDTFRRAQLAVRV